MVFRSSRSQMFHKDVLKISQIPQQRPNIIQILCIVRKIFDDTNILSTKLTKIGSKVISNLNQLWNLISGT